MTDPAARTGGGRASPPDRRHVAFLRAINVGGHTVKMDRLRALFGEMGYQDVETFIASGNVIFDAGRTPEAEVEPTIERHLFDALGYGVDTFVRPLAALPGIVEHQAFPDHQVQDGGTLYVGLLKERPPEQACRALVALNSDSDTFAVHHRELYWLARGRFSDSPVSGGVLEKTLGMPLTLRNANTLRRITAKYAG